MLDFNIFNRLWGIDDYYIKRAEDVYNRLQDNFLKLDVLSGYNQLKVISSLQKNDLSEHHFCGSTGYGYGDMGRALINDVMAELMGTESSLVSTYWVSGTHTIYDCLCALLGPGDILLSAVGAPYETLNKVIKKWVSSDKIKYKEVPLFLQTDQWGHYGTPSIDYELLKKELKAEPRVVFIQKSKGYSWRKTLLQEDIKRIVELVRKVSPFSYIFVDNCYGEFVEELEPGELGVDLLAGSLIKNPGGGIAPTGGYAAGKYQLIEIVAEELTAPGLGREMGATLHTNRDIIQGLYFAPKVVGEALKGALFNAMLFESLGYEVLPAPNDKRGDIIQAVKLKDKEKLLNFVNGVQKAGVVDSNLTPVSEQMPGYESEVVMAAGTFIQGASSELSADAPVEPPYTAFFQGGLTFCHSVLGSLLAAWHAR